MTAAADRAKAAEVLFSALDARETNTASWEAIADAQVNLVAAALAEARAPYDRLTAEVRALAEEWEANGGWDLDYAARLRGLVTDNSEEGTA